MDFCKAELAGDDCPAAILTQFVDFILLTNVDRCRDSQGFLTTGDLSTCWAFFHGARPKQKVEAARGRLSRRCWDIPFCQVRDVSEVPMGGRVPPVEHVEVQHGTRYFHVTDCTTIKVLNI
jgi:hypothetical protein